MLLEVRIGIRYAHSLWVAPTRIEDPAREPRSRVPELHECRLDHRELLQVVLERPYLVDVRMSSKAHEREDAVGDGNVR